MEPEELCLCALSCRGCGTRCESSTPGSQLCCLPACLQHYNGHVAGMLDEVAKLAKREVHRPGDLAMLLRAFAALDHRTVAVLDLLAATSAKAGATSAVCWYPRFLSHPLQQAICRVHVTHPEVVASILRN